MFRLTKTQFKEKFSELAGPLKPYLMKRAEELVDSGAVDLKNYGNDHRPPRIILQAVLKDAAENFRPPHPLDKKEVENLSHF